jgi:hypothetical protein
MDGARLQGMLRESCSATTRSALDGRSGPERRPPRRLGAGRDAAAHRLTTSLVTKARPVQPSYIGSSAGQSRARLEEVLAPGRRSTLVRSRSPGVAPPAVSAFSPDRRTGRAGWAPSSARVDPGVDERAERPQALSRRRGPGSVKRQISWSRVGIENVTRPSPARSRTTGHRRAHDHRTAGDEPIGACLASARVRRGSGGTALGRLIGSVAVPTTTWSRFHERRASSAGVPDEVRLTRIEAPRGLRRPIASRSKARRSRTCIGGHSPCTGSATT